MTNSRGQIVETMECKKILGQICLDAAETDSSTVGM